MALKNTKNIKQDSGFTIVELLIVIVVIAILATISIVAYNGVQARAKASSAQALSSNIAKKSEIYNTEPTTAGYPVTLATLTGAATSTTYYVDSASVIYAASVSASTTSPEKTVVFNKCGHSGTTTSPANLAAISTQTGIRVDYWNNGAVGSVSAGQASGSVGTFPVACWPAGS